jgi:DNA polymerase III epsilon subunit-like protein
MIDVETSGPIYGVHSLTEVGAAVGSSRQGTIDRFEALVQPIGEEVVTSHASFARAKREGLAPAEALRRFADWARPHVAEGARFVARPAAFDWPWIVYYAWRYLGENPFGFKAVCATSWFEALSRRFEVELPHVAVEDAEIQLALFLEAVSDRPRVME